MAQVRNRVTVPITEGDQVEADFVSFSQLSDDKEHIALIFKDGDQQEVPLVRMHSECLTGDVFHSARCDCGQQLDEAIRLMSVSGGVLLYLRQEGRGIGLYNKIDAYRLQDEGLDTFAANNALGFDHDLRDFTVAIEMLKAMGLSRVKLLTNNPEKVSILRKGGIEVVEAMSTGVFNNPHNERYLQAKKEVAKHQIVLGKQENSDPS